MKRTLYFSLLMISLVVTYTSVAQEDFRNTELVNTVFNALKSQSEKEFLKILPTRKRSGIFDSNGQKCSAQ